MISESSLKMVIIDEYTGKKDMKSIVASLMLVVGLAITNSAMAAEAEAPMPDVAKKNNCTACHAINHKVVGPSWMDVAKKYKGNSEAEAMLIKKVSKGGSGSWGSMPMPANDPAGKKQEQMKQLVEFILGLAK